MKTIKDNITNEIIISKSKFITKIYQVNSEDGIKDIISNLKLEYKGATHYCYAYIIDNVKRFSDDKEPNGTAGMPILNILEVNNLNHILCVVVRYFGGIKLGAGGLVRAYSTSTKEAINKSKIIELIEGLEIKIEFVYKNQKIIENILTNTLITKKEFSELNSYTIEISKENYNLIKDGLETLSEKIEIISNIYIKK